MSKTKKAVVKAPLSIEEQMAELSATIITNRLNIKVASDALKEQEETLKSYLLENNKEQIGSLRVEKALGSLYWTGDKGKGLQTKLAELTNSIDPKFKSVKLELEEISAAINSDPALYGQIARLGIGLERKADTTKLKEVKA